MSIHAMIQNDEVARKLKALKLFTDLPESVLSDLARGCSFTAVDDGERVFIAGDAAKFCFVVSFGAVRLSRQLPNGKEVVMCFCRTGEFIGAGIMMNTDPKYPVTATASETAGLIKIPRSVFIEKWQAEPNIAKAVNQHIMNRLMDFQQDRTMAVTSVPERIASFILRTLDQQCSDFGNRLNFRLSRKDIAERVGTSVETVIRVLSQWTQHGWIKTENQYIEIIDRRALESVVDREGSI